MVRQRQSEIGESSPEMGQLTKLVWIHQSRLMSSPGWSDSTFSLRVNGGVS